MNLVKNYIILYLVTINIAINLIHNKSFVCNIYMCVYFYYVYINKKHTHTVYILKIVTYIYVYI